MTSYGVGKYPLLPEKVWQLASESVLIVPTCSYPQAYASHIHILPRWLPVSCVMLSLLTAGSELLCILASFLPA